MKHSNFLSDSYLDVLFFNKNKTYGAYQIRANYSKSATKAVLVFFGSVALFLGSIALYQYVKTDAVIEELSSTAPEYDTTVVTLPKVAIDMPDEPVAPPSKALGTTLEQIKSTTYVTPKITKNELVDHSDLITLPIDSTFSISDKTNTEGVAGNNQAQGLADGVVGGTSLDSNALAIHQPKVQEETNTNFVYNRVDAKASAQYDINAFVAKRLRYPEMARANGIEGRVMVTFIVEKDGSITNVSFKGANIGGGCVEEAMNVIKAFPKWTPASVNGNFVRSYFQYPINFRLES